MAEMLIWGASYRKTSWPDAPFCSVPPRPLQENEKSGAEFCCTLVMVDQGECVCVCVCVSTCACVCARHTQPEGHTDMGLSGCLSIRVTPSRAETTSLSSLSPSQLSVHIAHSEPQVTGAKHHRCPPVLPGPMRRDQALSLVLPATHHLLRSLRLNCVISGWGSRGHLAMCSLKSDGKNQVSVHRLINSFS